MKIKKYHLSIFIKAICLFITIYLSINVSLYLLNIDKRRVYFIEVNRNQSNQIILSTIDEMPFNDDVFYKKIYGELIFIFQYQFGVNKIFSYEQKNSLDYNHVCNPKFKLGILPKKYISLKNNCMDLDTLFFLYKNDYYIYIDDETGLYIALP